MSLPLEGIKVLDISRLLPGPFCTMLLADMGAEVIKIENPSEPDYLREMGEKVKKESAYFLYINRNKKGLSLNLKKEEGKEIFLRLSENSDIIVESFRPGVMARLGLGYEVLKERNPAIIYCSITGYGQSGPYKEKVGHDINYISIGGILGLGITCSNSDTPAPLDSKHLTGPAIPPIPMADLGAGGMQAALAILMALIWRNKTGEGQYIDISMTDGVISWLGFLISEYVNTKKYFSKFNSGGFACYNVYRTRNGKYISLGAMEKKFWGNFCKAIEREDLIENQYNEIKKEEIISEIQSIFLTRTRDEWLRKLEGVDCCIAPVYDMDEILEDPQVKHRRIIAEQNHPTEGFLKMVGCTLGLSKTPGQIRIGAPSLGEHTVEILKDLGYKEETIKELAEKEII